MPATSVFLSELRKPVGFVDWIPAFAGMTVSLTRGRAGKMLAKKTRIYDLAMQTSVFEVCGLSRGTARQTADLNDAERRYQ